MMKRCFVIIILVVVIIMLPSCIVTKTINTIYDLEYYSYYSKDSNYFSYTGEIESIAYDEYRNVITLSIIEIEPDIRFVDCFEIKGAGVRAVLESGFLEEVECGQKIDFVCAPKIFHNGYVIPIMAISGNSKCYLSFKEGKEGYLQALWD